MSLRTNGGRIPGRRGSPGLGSEPATAATVGLATAAHALGFSLATARTLAEHDVFPCSVIRTMDGYRVPFAALVRVLRSARADCAEPAPGCSPERGGR